MEKQSKAKWTIVLLIGALYVCFFSVYLGVSVFFMNHFYIGTTINEVDVSGRTIQEANALLNQQALTYTLTLEERMGDTDKKQLSKEEIEGKSIDLKYDFVKTVQSIKTKQNPLLWLFSGFMKRDFQVMPESSYNHNKLQQAVQKLACLQEKNSQKPQNAKLVYQKGGYCIEEGKAGNLVSQKKLDHEIKAAIENNQKTLNLEEAGCYEKAPYPAEHPAVAKAKEDLEKYLKAKITYKINDKQIIIDQTLIHNWLKVNDQMQVVLDEEAVSQYIQELCNKYSTLGKARTFRASTGNLETVSGGDYGWLIDKDKETAFLLDAIKTHKVVSREPKYLQKALYPETEGIGDTYVEVNLTRQHLWFYKEGRLVTEGNVVTGDVSRNRVTPPGVYKLDYKQRHATLRGPGYATPVSFWMPFNGGIGIHDAVWRGSFGGSIYRNNGSHGCVNVSYATAQAVFNEIEPGMPVICYHD